VARLIQELAKAQALNHPCNGAASNQSDGWSASLPSAIALSSTTQILRDMAEHLTQKIGRE